MAIETITGLMGFVIGFAIAFQTAREIYKPQVNELEQGKKTILDTIQSYVDANKDKELEKLEKLL
jgi:phage host-nuclease inhibitor protein Gam